MNFKNIGNMDCIVSFAPAKKEMAGVASGVYIRGRNKKIDELVFNRTKGAKLNIQASNFSQNRKTQCSKPIAKCDADPYLRKTKVRAIDGKLHTIHTLEEPDAPDFVRAVFNAAEYVVVTATKFGGYQVACAVNGDIRKMRDGTYSLVPSSLRKVYWKPKSDMFRKQLEITKEAKRINSALNEKTEVFAC